MSGTCATCGPTGPYVETHIAVAIMRAEDEHVQELLDGLSYNALGDVEELGQVMEDVAARRMSTMEPRTPA